MECPDNYIRPQLFPRRYKNGRFYIKMQVLWPFDDEKCTENLNPIKASRPHLIFGYRESESWKLLKSQKIRQFF